MFMFTATALSETAVAAARKCARGDWQRGIVGEMLHQNRVTNPVSELRGRAKNYAGKYSESFHSLLARLKSAGIVVTRTPGPKGGEWSATYSIDVAATMFAPAAARMRNPIFVASH